ncbi:MAG: GDP-mannose 4,6-dehydratase [Smithellaceae bacterium]
MKKALILGITGQDGSWLAKLLLEKGYQVSGTSRDAEMTRLDNLRQLNVLECVGLYSVAIRDFRSVLQVIIKTEPDEIYNLSGQTSVALSFAQPVETFESISVGNLNLLEAIRLSSRKTRLYNACSGECFGNTNGEAADEQTPFRPRSPYAVAKAAAFWQAANYREAYDIFVSSGILFNHESPLRPERFVTQKIIAAACRIARGSRETLALGNMKVERDWGWAPDYVEAMWRMLQQEDADDYVIATGETSGLGDFTKEAFSALGMDWQDHVRHDPALLRPSDILSARANPAKAARKLGWRARYKMKDVIRLMLDAQKQGLDGKIEH